jgi:hypothetical protein
MIFETEDFIYLIDKKENETLNYYNTKMDFIVKCNPKTEKEIEEIEKYAIIYSNMINLGCKYSEQINNKIKSLY